MGLGLLGMPQVSFPWLRADWSCLGIPRTSRQCTFGRIPGFRCSFLISEKNAFQRDRRHLLTLHLRIWCISQVMQRLTRNSPGSVKPKPQIPFSCKAVALRAVNSQLSSVTVVSEWFDSKINEGLDEGLVATFLSWKRVEAWEEPRPASYICSPLQQAQQPRSDKAILFRSEIIGEAITVSCHAWLIFFAARDCQIVSIKYPDGSGPFYVRSLVFLPVNVYMMLAPWLCLRSQ